MKHERIKLIYFSALKLLDENRRDIQPLKSDSIYLQNWHTSERSKKAVALIMDK